jgi:hypothetical protein
MNALLHQTLLVQRPIATLNVKEAAKATLLSIVTPVLTMPPVTPMVNASVICTGLEMTVPSTHTHILRMEQAAMRCVKDVLGQLSTIVWIA